MDFGIFFELSVPRPFTGDAERRVYENALEQARVADALGLPMLGTFGVLNAHLLSTREAYPTRAYQSLAALAPRPSTDEDSPGERRPVPEGIAIGDPDQVVAAIKRWESVGVDSLNFIINAAEVIPQQTVLDSLRLFAHEVMPKFAGIKGSRVERLPINEPRLALSFLDSTNLNLAFKQSIETDDPK